MVVFAALTSPAMMPCCEIAWSVRAVPEEAEPLFTDSYQRGLDHLRGRLDAR